MGQVNRTLAGWALVKPLDERSLPSPNRRPPVLWFLALELGVLLPILLG